MTFRQLALVDFILLIAVALQLNRGKLPARILPEYWGMQREQAANADLLRDLELSRKETVRFRGSSVLLVGDSRMRENPWPQADALILPGRTQSEIRERFLREIGGRQYTLLILWYGAGALGFAHDPVTYAEETRAFLAVAAAHADRLAVLGPVPSDGRQWRRQTGRQGRLDISRDLVVQAQGLLHPLPAGCEFYDAAGFYEQSLDAHTLRRDYSDNLHLTLAGWRRFAQYLAAAGLQVEPDGAPERH